MQIDAFDFHLPEERIALEPVSPRDASRMLHVGKDGLLHDDLIKSLTNYFKEGDALVLNDSRVIPARLTGVRRRNETEASIQVNLHKKINDHEWLAFAKPAKRLQAGDVIVFGQSANVCFQGALAAKIAEVRGGGEFLLSFELSGVALQRGIDEIGEMPLPPYIVGKRAVTSRDKETYQTIYSSHEGSVAAPTAGLHFSDNLFEKLNRKGVQLLYVTLHVGAGTFLPVKSDNIDQHKMHSEWGEVSDDVVSKICSIKANGGRVCAVGTTSLRLLETAALKTGTMAAYCGDTDIFIKPGFEFQVVDRLLTNFHLPRSTLFMLVSAFSGLDVMQRAYAHAIDQNYRFYSYGDACLLERTVK